ncbi:MAG: DegT/DnrJ/EryC1/StrS family aminotransferase [Tannerellaceae bacterium]|nr:DegT/DnrJ/EryC1/StrS family aminotransferase [Tannerellaceae bacterium]
MDNIIRLSIAHMGGHEQAYIERAFDTNWVTPLGPNVDRFEQFLSAYTGTACRVVALSSGTAAIHLGLVLLEVKPGDEVICQSFTFAATVNPVTYLGGVPVLVDSERDTWNMDPSLLEKAILDRLEKSGRLPKAIIPVHLYGMPAKMDEIMAIADRYHIPILEDAAEALGSEYDGQKCGTLGRLGVLSFNGNKMITTSGGGALICRTEQEAGRIVFLATQARDDAPHYQHSEIGYNYRLSNICAGIGCGQMHVLDEHVERRRAIHALYAEWLKGVPGVTVMERPGERFNPNYWLTCITVDPRLAGKTRDDIRLALLADHIESRPLWKPMHLQPVFSGLPFYGSGVSEQLFETGLCLPSGSSLTDEEIEQVVNGIKSCININ